MQTASIMQNPALASERPSCPSMPERVVRGLDSIRFWCALWVYFSHFGFFPLPHISTTRAVAGLYNNLFCGIAAVVAFFVISGFCIHYPYVGGQAPVAAAYYVRRYVRILPPVLAALLLGRVLGQSATDFYQAIIWSLAAEVIYYTIYPVLRPVLARWPSQCVGIAFAVSLILAAARPDFVMLQQFGFGLTWLVGLPSWLLGCRLAKFTAEDVFHAAAKPWIWRALVWAGSCAASILRFHAGIGYPLTMTLFGVLVYFWLRAEMRYYRATNPPRFTEFCGQWSYSIYLVHGPAVLWFARLSLPRAPIPLWILQTAAVLAASFLFYLTVERPSHLLARRMARLAGRAEVRYV